MKEIGEFLKSSRIENGVSLEEACEDLNLTVEELENIEDGNVRAFKDLYQLRELVKDYAKYLGVETDSVVNEFNDFMFDHTSKISLDDLKEARKLAKEDTKKISSPYTKIKTSKISFDQIKWKPIFITIGILLGIIIILFLWLQFGHPKEQISRELMGSEESIYEFTY